MMDTKPERSRGYNLSDCVLQCDMFWAGIITRIKIGLAMAGGKVRLVLTPSQSDRCWCSSELG